MLWNWQIMFYLGLTKYLMWVSCKSLFLENIRLIVDISQRSLICVFVKIVTMLIDWKTGRFTMPGTNIDIKYFMVKVWKTWLHFCLIISVSFSF